MSSVLTEMTSFGSGSEQTWYVFPKEAFPQVAHQETSFPVLVENQMKIQTRDNIAISGGRCI